MMMVCHRDLCHRDREVCHRDCDVGHRDRELRPRDRALRHRDKSWFEKTPRVPEYATDRSARDWWNATSAGLNRDSWNGTRGTRLGGLQNATRARPERDSWNATRRPGTRLGVLERDSQNATRGSRTQEDVRNQTSRICSLLIHLKIPYVTMHV